MKKINRRKFLILSYSSAIATLIAQCSVAKTQEDRHFFHHILKLIRAKMEF